MNIQLRREAKTIEEEPGRIRPGSSFFCVTLKRERDNMMNIFAGIRPGRELVSGAAGISCKNSFEEQHGSTA